MAMYNTDASIRGFAKASFEYALDRQWPLYLRWKSRSLSFPQVGLCLLLFNMQALTLGMKGMQVKELQQGERHLSFRDTTLFVVR